MAEKSTNPQRLLLLTAAGLLVFLFFAFEWRLLLLAFAGLLLAVLLETATAWVEHRTRLGHTWAYLLTLGGILAIAAGAAMFIVPRAITQFDQLAVVVPQALAQARHYLENRSWGTSLLHIIHKAMLGISLGPRIQMITSAITSGLIDIIVIVVIGLFGALNPEGYSNGILLLFPPAYRERARGLAAEIAGTLRWWLLGQMVPMLALGIASMVSLWLLGVHLAFILGLFTGLMVFVPYAGSILAGVPSILIALQRSPRTALIVLVLYLLFHLCEGYFLTPIAQKKAVRLPPILTVLFQFFMWSFAGLLGVAVAAPLAAVGLVLVKELYLSRRFPHAEASRTLSAL